MCLYQIKSNNHEGLYHIMDKYANKLTIPTDKFIEGTALSPINQALSKLMKLHDLDDRGLAKAIGQGHANIARMRTDPKVNPTISTLVPIAIFFGVTVDQLIHNSLSNMEFEFNNRQVPLIRFADLDYWIENQQQHETKENTYIKYDADNKSKSIFCFKLSTNEYEPLIKKNAKIFVDSKQEIKNSSLVLIKFNSSITIYKVLKVPDGYFIRSLKDISKNQIKLSSAYKIYGVIIEVVFL